MNFSIIIPTKNRYDDLLKAIDSIVNQKRHPDELILVDQSGMPISENDLNDLKSRIPATNLKYIYNTSIKGLVHAKSVGVSVATKDIICFLEDDIVLEKDYCFELISGFESNPLMIGSSGIITNLPYSSKMYSLMHKLFHRGIFYDPRPKLYYTVVEWEKDLVMSNVLSGGLSSWRKEVFEHVTFDLHHHFHMLEDFEFSFRAFSYYGPTMYINRRAKLAHNFAPAGRNSEFGKNKRKALEYRMFYRKNVERQFALLSFLWLSAGLFATSLIRSISIKNSAPLLGLYNGMISKI